MPTSPRKPWTRDELIVAMNLYTRIPFGQISSRHPIIIEVAAKLGRTPASLSMKLGNLASFDPALRERGVLGLTGASKLDAVVWNEFEEDWDIMGAESEIAFDQLMRSDLEAAGGPTAKPLGELDLNLERSTDRYGQVKQRVGHRFFQTAVLTSYQMRCCITGNPIRELLTASHIVPWKDSTKDRLNPRNGLCLAKTQDAAFDQGLITLDEDLRVVLSNRIRDHITVETLRDNFQRYEGKTIALPHRFTPEPVFLEHHRQKVFVA